MSTVLLMQITYLMASLLMLFITVLSGLKYLMDLVQLLVLLFMQTLQQELLL
jgi:hypothetical protein